MNYGETGGQGWPCSGRTLNSSDGPTQLTVHGRYEGDYDNDESASNVLVFDHKDGHKP